MNDPKHETELCTCVWYALIKALIKEWLKMHIIGIVQSTVASSHLKVSFIDETKLNSHGHNVCVCGVKQMPIFTLITQKLP